MKVDYDFQTDEYTISDGAEIQLVDRGFDFYAPQTFEDEAGRRILIGWMGIPEAEYTNPTVERGWQHALTIPRQLHVKNGRLYQEPLKELEELRGEKHGFAVERAEQTDSECMSWNGRRKSLCFELCLTLDICEKMNLTLRKGVTLTWEHGILTLDLGTCGSGRTTRSVEVECLENLRIYSDTTSIEIFVNDGAEVFTTRVYGQEMEIRLECLCREAECFMN